MGRRKTSYDPLDRPAPAGSDTYSELLRGLHVERFAPSQWWSRKRPAPQGPTHEFEKHEQNRREMEKLEHGDSDIETQ